MAFPVVKIVRSALLSGQQNGKLSGSILDETPGQAGGPGVLLVKPAARAWRALCAAALKDGHILKVSGPASAYRPYADQERIFLQRYRREFKANTDVKIWNGVKWYRWSGATAAAPGTSNHGWAQAVDTGEENDGDTGTESVDAGTVAWLVAHEQTFGWSHELDSEPWHIHYWAGDAIPAAVLAFERTAPTTPPEDDDVIKATYIRQRNSPRVYLAGIGMTPRPVGLFKDAEYHAKREGIVILDPPTDADQDVPDGEGTVRKVMLVDDGSLFGIS